MEGEEGSDRRRWELRDGSDGLGVFTGSRNKDIWSTRGAELLVATVRPEPQQCTAMMHQVAASD